MAWPNKKVSLCSCHSHHKYQPPVRFAHSSSQRITELLAWSKNIFDSRENQFRWDLCVTQSPLESAANGWFVFLWNAEQFSQAIVCSGEFIMPIKSKRNPYQQGCLESTPVCIAWRMRSWFSAITSEPKPATTSWKPFSTISWMVAPVYWVGWTGCRRLYAFALREIPKTLQGEHWDAGKILAYLKSGGDPEVKPLNFRNGWSLKC